MAKRKAKEVLDWYGNPIEGHRDGHFSHFSRHFVMGEIEDGKEYLRIYSESGVPGDRIALEDCYTRIEDVETKKVLYDSRLEPPSDAKLLPDYIGYAREKQLKRYFPK